MSLKFLIGILSLFLKFTHINPTPLNSLQTFSQSLNPCDISKVPGVQRSPLLLYSPKNSLLYFICNGKIVSSKYISNKRVDWDNNYSSYQNNLIELDNYAD